MKENDNYKGIVWGVVASIVVAIVEAIIANSTMEESNIVMIFGIVAIVMAIKFGMPNQSFARVLITAGLCVFSYLCYYIILTGFYELEYTESDSFTTTLILSVIAGGYMGFSNDED